LLTYFGENGVASEKPDESSASCSARSSGRRQSPAGFRSPTSRTRTESAVWTPGSTVPKACGSATTGFYLCLGENRRKRFYRSQFAPPNATDSVPRRRPLLTGSGRRRVVRRRSTKTFRNCVICSQQTRVFHFSVKCHFFRRRAAARVVWLWRSGTCLGPLCIGVQS